MSLDYIKGSKLCNKKALIKFGLLGGGSTRLAQAQKVGLVLNKAQARLSLEPGLHKKA